MAKLKSLCCNTIEEIKKNKKTKCLLPSYNEEGAIDLENLQENDDLEKLLSDVTQLNEDFYTKLSLCITSNCIQHILGLNETIAELREKFDLLKASALKRGLLQEEKSSHKIINTMTQIILIKEYIFESIINGDFLKRPSKFMSILTNKINKAKDAQALYYYSTVLLYWARS